MELNYQLLRKREIIDILDGDTTIEEYNGVKVGMPYLSGPALCELSTMFGYAQTYKWGKGFANLSRWQYLDNLLEFCIKTNKVSLLLAYMLDKERFQGVLCKINSAEEIENTYKYIYNKIVEKINSLLYFGGNELKLVGKRYIVTKIDSKIEIETPNIKIIDRKYIKELSERAMKDIDEGSLDSSITKARTILEETFCYVIEQKAETPDSSGDIKKLYKQVKDLYNMHTDKQMDIRINKILSGLENIVSGIAEMRNNGSDSHGLGNKRINILSYHARLAVNAAVIMAEFILAVAQKQNSNPV